MDWLPLLQALADAADEISTRYFRRSDLPVERKPDRSLVTAADLEVESAMRDIVAKRHPELGVFGEEQGEHHGASGSRLIVDPIDATANFARGLPIFATLLAIEAEEVSLIAECHPHEYEQLKTKAPRLLSCFHTITLHETPSTAMP